MLSDNNADFCSPECENQYNEKDKKLPNEENKKLPTCKYCNKTILNPGVQGTDYCSIKCRIEAVKKIRLKKKVANSKDIDENTLYEIVEFKVITLLARRKDIEKNFGWAINYFDIAGFRENIKEKVRQRG